MALPFLRTLDPARRRLLIWVGVLAALLALGLLWTRSPLAKLLNTGTLQSWLMQFREGPWDPLLLLAMFLVGGLLVLPVTLVVLATVMVYGPWLGFLYALIGSTASGALSFGIGRLVGHRSLQRLPGSRIHTLSRRIGEHGILSLAVLRVVPVAHFTVVSLAAGTSHVRFSAFIVGTMAGMIPGLIVVIVLADRLAAAARHPAPYQLLLATLVGLAVITPFIALRRWLRNRRPGLLAGRGDLSSDPEQ